MTFRERLHEAARRKDSWVCVGLDPDPAKLPRAGDVADEMLHFLLDVIDRTKDVACAYKPNAAFFDALGGSPPPEPTRANLDPAGYAQLLFDLGFDEQHVRLQVYGHVLASTAEVVEWAKGTGLTRLKGPLGPELYERFVERYRERLIELLGWHEPYFYTFKRILFWARRES